VSRITSLGREDESPRTMTSKRHTIVGKAPFGTVRADAREAIVRAWKAAGWPRPPRTETGYEHLQQCMAIYLQILFPEISPSRRDDIVGQALREFMAPLHARRHRHDHPPPEDLVRALEDVALDQADDLLWVGRNDQQVATLAFGATPEDVRVGLAGLAVDGKALEFRVVTQYLDLVDLDPSRPPSSAEVVAGLGSGTATEQMVRQALLDFRQRLKAVAADDHA
jgi:hypothetical protein